MNKLLHVKKKLTPEEAICDIFYSDSAEHSFTVKEVLVRLKERRIKINETEIEEIIANLIDEGVLEQIVSRYSEKRYRQILPRES